MPDVQIGQAARLRRAGVSRVAKILVAGIRPQTTFGVEVHVLSPSELKELEGASAATLPPYGKEGRR